MKNPWIKLAPGEVPKLPPGTKVQVKWTSDCWGKVGRKGARRTAEIGSILWTIKPYYTHFRLPKGAVTPAVAEAWAKYRDATKPAVVTDADPNHGWVDINSHRVTIIVGGRDVQITTERGWPLSVNVSKGENGDE